jgi:uncharacterized protein YggT (Ycf19 family)
MYVLCSAVYVLLDFMWLALMLHAILSWFVPDEDAWYMRALSAISLPAVYPFRALFARFGWFEDLPIDLAPMFAMVALFLITGLLPAIPY